jgi:hypothetical protein
MTNHVVSASALGVSAAAIMNWLPTALGLLGAFLAVVWYAFEIVDNPVFQRLWAKLTHKAPAVTPLPLRITEDNHEGSKVYVTGAAPNVPAASVPDQPK